MLYVQAEGYSKVEDKSVKVEVCGEAEEAKSFQALLQQDQSGTAHTHTHGVTVFRCSFVQLRKRAIQTRREVKRHREGGEE